MDAQPLADLLQALADSTRLRILALLRRMELSVGELAIILEDAGAVERRREGSWVFLTIACQERTEPMFALVDAWADPASESAFASDASKLDRIRTDRAEAAGRYFSSHADTWDSIRSL